MASQEVEILVTELGFIETKELAVVAIYKREDYLT